MNDTPTQVLSQSHPRQLWFLGHKGKVLDMPKTLAKYEIRGLLGRGAMGMVYDGWDPLISRRVAIKCVQLSNAPHSVEIRRFRREAQAAGRLAHQNIVTVHDYGETSEFAYIVMEFVEGTTLKSMLDQKVRFSLDQIYRLMSGVLAGLAFSHERRVIHRDIKPANIMLNKEGVVKIADFGLAYIDVAGSLTQDGTYLGTPLYTSPEQFLCDPTDPRSDIYSAGVVLYQLLTGKCPFQGSLHAIMQAVLHRQAPDPSTIADHVPPAIDAIVSKAMARYPADRFQSAKAFADALRGAVAVSGRQTSSEALQAAPVSPQPRAQAPRQRRIAVHPWAYVSIAAALAAGAGTAWYSLRPEPVRYDLPEGETRDCASCPQLKELRPGTLNMGVPMEESLREGTVAADSDSRPVRPVSIRANFWMGKYPVTRGQYGQFADATGRPMPEAAMGQAADHPVVNISRRDAQEYALWLSKLTGKHYRLPTESEWEYAARAGTTTSRFWGDQADTACKFANSSVCRDRFQTTSPVGSFSANNFALHDMLGNASQWVEDCYRAYRPDSPSDGSAENTGNCQYGITRGGSWMSQPNQVRAGVRTRVVPSHAGNTVGFRVVRE